MCTIFLLFNLMSTVVYANPKRLIEYICDQQQCVYVYCVYP